MQNPTEDDTLDTSVLDFLESARLWELNFYPDHYDMPGGQIQINAEKN